MKIITSILLLFLFCIAGYSQDLLIVEPNPSSVQGDAADQPHIAYAEVTNHSNETQTIIWERIVESVPDGWETHVCTSWGCAPSETNTGSFDILPGETLNLDGQFDPTLSGGIGFIEVLIYFASDTTISEVAVFQGDFSPVSTKELQPQNFEVFPNPTVNYINLPVNSNAKHLKIINIFGTLYYQNGYMQKTINVEDWPGGIYVIQFLDTEDRILATSLMQKL